MTGLINLGVKRTGKPSAGNPHAGFDAAGAGNQLTVRLVRHSQRKRGATDRPDLRSERRQSSTLLSGGRWSARKRTTSDPTKACRDPEDDKFLAAATEGKAGYVVSGDKDLLSLKKYRNVQIVRPAAFLKILRKEEKGRGEARSRG